MTMKLNLNNKMVKGIVKVLPFCLFTFLPLNVAAQTFTQRLQETAKGEATVTIHHDQAIDKLVNGVQTATANTVTAPTKPAVKTGETKPATAAATKRQTESRSETDKNANQQAQHNAGTQITNDSTSLEHKPSYKTTGYRIQVYAGGNSRKDRQKAEQIGNQLRMLFPLEAVYVHFYSPRWICRMGNYKTQEEALQALQDVKKLGYSAATIVKGKITVQY